MGRTNSRRDDCKTILFPFYVGNNSIRLPTLKWEEENSEWIATEKPLADEKIVYPIDENGVERNWRWGLDTAINNVNSLKVERKGG